VVQRWQQSSNALSRATVGLVLIDLPTTNLELRGTASDVWRILQEPRSTAEITTELSHRYGADRETVGTDVEGLVEQLASEGALVPVRS
jgi:hypothetical protein